MAVIVLDPGCVDATSHNAAVDYAFRDECRRLGARFLCFYNVKANAAITAELGGSPVFRSYIPYGRGAQPESVIHEFRHLATLFLAELEEHVSEMVQEGDTLVAHTVTAPHIAAMGAWLKRLAKPLRLRIVLRFHPGFRATPAQEQLLKVSYTGALKDYAVGIQRHDVRVFTDSDILAAYYRDLAGIPVQAAPIPIDFGYVQDGGPDDGALRFLYLGEAREEKGFGLLPDAIRYVYSRGHDVRFTIQVPHLTAEQAAKIPSVDGRLQWISNSLLPAPYYRLLSTASAVLVPYDKHEYTYRTSHIFVEALGFAKPVVTMQGTWMETEMQRMPAIPGSIATQFSGQALGDSICDVVENWMPISEAAKALAPNWRAFHNIQNFARTLLA